MQTTVTVSRSFTFDPDSQSDVLAEIKSLRDRGFRVLGEIDPEALGRETGPTPLGGLEPIERVAKGRPRSGIPTADIKAAINEIVSLTGLTKSAIALLVGVNRTALGAWQNGTRGISASKWLEVQSLLRRSRTVDNGDKSLHSEARGLFIAAKRKKGDQPKKRGRAPRVSLTDDQKIEIATLRDGGLTLRKISEKYGVTISRVRDVLALFA